MQRYLRISEVVELTGVSRATIYRWQQLGHFPQRRQIGPGSVGYVESEVRDWILSRPKVGENGERKKS